MNRRERRAERKRQKKEMKSSRPLSALREFRSTNPEHGGEIVYTIHPLFRALSEHYGSDDDDDDEHEMEAIQARIAEFAKGERRLPDGVAERTLEIDAEHQAEGCPDENLIGLIELMRDVYDGKVVG